MIGGAAAAVAASAVAVRYRPEWAAGIAAAVFVLVVAPVPAVAVAGLALAVARFRRGSRRDRLLRQTEGAVIEGHELVVLGLSGGLSLAAAVAVARDHAPGEARPFMSGLLARADHVGMLGSLTEAGEAGSGASIVMASALAAGAPVVPALRAHLDLVHHRRHTERIEALRRLPVKLLVPMTLLVLPGFVVMSVGPTVADSLARLSIF